VSLVTSVSVALPYLLHNKSSGGSVVRLEVRKILRSAGFVAILMLLGGIYALALANTITTG
jgi:hypothetical protein